MVTPTAPARLGYFAQTRSWTLSAIVALPIMLAYELGVRVVDAALGTPVRNGADALLQSVVGLLGHGGALVLPAMVAAVLGFLAFRERKRGIALDRGVILGMLAESLAYAAIFGGVVGRLTALVLPRALAMLGTGGVGQFPVWAQVVLSLGAGFYEEVLFRGLLLGGLRWAIGFATARPWIRDGSAVLIASLLFSAYHHVGPYADPFSFGVFTFRFVSGLVFSAMLVTRGFGITVATHAFYDVLFSLGLVFT